MMDVSLGHRRMCQCEEKTKLSQTQTKEDVRVADGAVSDETADVKLLEAEELDVAANRLPRANGRDNNNVVGARLLERIVLGGIHAGRLVRSDVRALRDHANSDSTASHLHARAKRPVDAVREYLVFFFWQ
jgi:hypothetical protein